MKRLSIRVALTGMLSLIIFAIVALSFTSYSSLTRLNNNTQDIGQYWMSRMMLAREMKGNFNLMRLAYSRLIMAATPGELENEIKSINDTAGIVQKSVNDYESGARTEKGRALINGFKPEFEAYRALGEELIAIKQDGQTLVATSLFKGKMKAQSEKVNAVVDDLVAYVISNADKAVSDSDTIYQNNLLTTLGIAAATLMMAIGGITYAVIGVTRPIGRISSSMRSLAAGDLESNIPFEGRADEVGEMATAVEVFRQAGIKNRELERQAEEARIREGHQDAESRRRAAEEAEKLRFATTTLAAGLKRLAAGDVSFELNETFSAEYEPLRQDFNASLKQLGTALSSVMQSVENIDTGTREISSGANDLSKRTEQQAAALEETAAALDQITVNVSTSSKRTEEARTVAILANQNAAKSAEVVSNAEEAMRRIEESSQQISNIIGVIDEIAFQTNLLALNAGVEAARAGEAGKGFAVVAQEVRELAQRSANAAKEIKGLIQNSSTEVGNGVQLVRDTGVALKAIGDYVSQINQLMDAIATSAREQSTGLAEVNTAVNQMDQTTQQNAAMVEQSTAASAALAQEATRLRSLVSQFNLSGRVNAPAASERGPAAAQAPVRRALQVHGNLAAKEEWSEF
ncbi:methyl-accepting chemotaxis protein [Rhizobium rhizophilum]|uniref:HAMP domain-containing protein n=1 Tax=Rhizobium rhizophilum TaxID=1850373 RepID=A0ABY2QSC7_9HYPH|nr:HAMP domain-containing methyl-accepting chemotaxis protein [Rhizobium rhizophilum]THV12519.1 HAMP domain-containing protein [Rhizobium rhizophilum]